MKFHNQSLCDRPYLIDNIEKKIMFIGNIVGLNKLQTTNTIQTADYKYKIFNIVGFYFRG